MPHALLLAAVSLLVALLPAQRGGRGLRWAHVEKLYDANGDGAITPEEYGRGQRGFDNLDRDDDGEITPADFDRRRGTGRRDARPNGERDGSEQRLRTVGDMYGSFLDIDGEPGLSTAERDRLIELLEPNEDGAIAADAFANVHGTAVKSRMSMMLNRRITDAFDHDRDGTVTVADIHRVFAALDTDDDGLIEQGEEIQLPPGVGQVAPDFTLPLAGDEAQLVTLSSFRGDKPVALIFGSYT